MTAQLVVISGPDIDRSFTILPGESLVVGRSSTTPTKLKDQHVSRTHCEIAWDGTEAVIANRSDKGTWLNGLVIDRERIRHGDVVQIGETQLSFRVTDLENSDTVLQDAAG